MDESKLDAAREIERLRSTYGDIVIRPDTSDVRPRGFWWGLKTGGAMLILAGLLLYGSIQSHASVDVQQKIALASRAKKPAAAARTQATMARARADALSAQADSAAAAAEIDTSTRQAARNALLAAKEAEAVARFAELNAKAFEMNAGTDQPPGRASVREYIRNPESSFQALRLRTQQLLSITAFVVGLLFAVAAFGVVLIPWVRQQVSRLAETLVSNAAAPPAAGSRSDASAGGTAPPVSFFMPRTSAFGQPMALGSFILPSAIAASAVAVTIGAFTLNVPSRDVTLNVAEPEMAQAKVKVNQIGINVPSKTFDIPADKVFADYEGATAHVPAIAVRLPDVAVDRSYMKQVAQALANYSTITSQQVEVEKALVARNTTLQQQTFDLTTALLMRPTSAQFDELRESVTREKTSSERLTGKLDDTNDLQDRAARLSAIAMTRNILSENDRVSNIFLHRTLLDENCGAYQYLQAAFPEMLKQDGCSRRTRRETLTFWRRSHPSAFRLPPTMTVKKKHEPSEQSKEASKDSE